MKKIKDESWDYGDDEDFVPTRSDIEKARRSVIRERSTVSETRFIEMVAQLTIPQEVWKARAACAGVSPDLFFPPRGADREVAADVRALCSGCPVKTECLEFALTTKQKDGIWGGTSGRERRILWRQRRGAA